MTALQKYTKEFGVEAGIINSVRLLLTSNVEKVDELMLSAVPDQAACLL